MLRPELAAADPRQGARGRAVRRQHARGGRRCRPRHGDWVLFEKELGRANYALHYTGVGRPSNILLAGTEAQRERYLYPACAASASTAWR